MQTQCLDCSAQHPSSVDELDRREWTLCSAAVTHGVRVPVRATSPAHWENVQGALTLDLSACPPEAADLTYSIIWGYDLAHPFGHVAHQLFRDTACICRTSDPETLLYTLQTDATWRVAT